MKIKSINKANESIVIIYFLLKNFSKFFFFVIDKYKKGNKKSFPNAKICKNTKKQINNILETGCDGDINKNKINKYPITKIILLLSIIFKRRNEKINKRCFIKFKITKKSLFLYSSLFCKIIICS